MKVLAFFAGLFSSIAAITTWAAPSIETFSSDAYLNEDALPADTYLRLSDMRCESCTLIVRDLIEVGAIGNIIGAVKAALNGGTNYDYRFSLLTECIHCYRAVHFWEMNMLNRPATNDEIQHWLQSRESKPLIEYFSTL